MSNFVGGGSSYGVKENSNFKLLTLFLQSGLVNSFQSRARFDEIILKPELQQLVALSGFDAAA